MNAVITDRDAKAIQFINDFGIVGVSQLASTIYAGKKSASRIARRRLHILAEHHLVSRLRLGQNSEYYYYTGKKPPERRLHHLRLVDVYIALQKLGGEIKEWKREPDWGTLRPDAYCKYELNFARPHFAIEIENNSNPFDQHKYEADWQDQQKAAPTVRRFKSYPKILIVSEGAIKPEPSELKYIVVKPDLIGIEAILK
jgi:hypothetical protein